MKAQNTLMNADRKAYIDNLKDDEGFNYSEAVDDYWKGVDVGLDDQLAKLRKAKL